MTLPDTLALWASSATYSGSGGATKSALSAGRLAEGYLPLAHAIAAQEANEYLHRMGDVIDQHRDAIVSLAERVPGIHGPETLPLVVQAVSGTYDWNFQSGGGTDNAWGWRVQAGQTAYFKIELPPLAKVSRIDAVVRGIGTYSAPGWTGTIYLGQATPGQEWFGAYREDGISSGASMSDWTEVQSDGAAYSPALSTYHRQGVVAISATVACLVIGFTADFEQYA